MKMLWDDEYLYIAALMDLEAGQERIANFTKRNEPIFQKDVSGLLLTFSACGAKG